MLLLARFLMNPVDQDGRISALLTLSSGLSEEETAGDVIAWALEQMRLSDARPKDVVKQCLPSVMSKFPASATVPEPAPQPSTTWASGWGDAFGSGWESSTAASSTGWGDATPVASSSSWGTIPVSGECGSIASTSSTWGKVSPSKPVANAVDVKLAEPTTGTSADDLPRLAQRLTEEQRLELERTVDNEAISMLKALQLQPSLQEPYRRFVLVTDTGSGAGSSTGPQAVSPTSVVVDQRLKSLECFSDRACHHRRHFC